MTGFQTQVGVQPAPAVAGDFASTNPRRSVVAGQAGIVAGAAGVVIARAVWLSKEAIDNDNAPAVANNYGAGPIAGIVHREQQALITTYLTESGLTIPGGFQMGAIESGDLWVVNDGDTLAQVGMKVYADLSTGKFRFGATGATGTASGSASTIAAGTASVTGGITGNLMTVSAVGSGVLYPGSTLSGSGVQTGTKIVKQVTPLLAGEAAGGIGRYIVSIVHDTAVIPGTTISTTYGLLTVGGTVAGTFKLGGLVGGSGVTACYITALVSGAGGAGTYIVDATQTISSQSITATTEVETNWNARSAGYAGELIKISSHTPG